MNCRAAHEGHEVTRSAAAGGGDGGGGVLGAGRHGEGPALLAPRPHVRQGPQARAAQAASRILSGELTIVFREIVLTPSLSRVCACQCTSAWAS